MRFDDKRSAFACSKRILFICFIGERVEFSEKNSGEIEKISEFLSELKNVSKIRLLPYHKYAEAKYLSLEIKNRSPKVLPTKEELESAKVILRKKHGDKVL